MSCLLYVDEEEANNKISIDDLYEKKHQRDLKQISIFNKLLICIKYFKFSKTSLDNGFVENGFINVELFLIYKLYNEYISKAYIKPSSSLKLKN